MSQHPPLKLIYDMLARLDVLHSEGDITFRQHEIPTVSSQLAEHLVASGLIKIVYGNPACVECGASADTQRGGDSLNAICDTCGAVFAIHANEPLEYHADITGLAVWLCRLLQHDADPERVDDGIYFLGHHQQGSTRYELHLMRGSTWQDANTRQQIIVQQKQKDDPAIVLHLSRKPVPVQHRDIQMISVASCLSYNGNDISWRWPEDTFAGKNSVKQYAAQVKVASDPRQQCREQLKGFIQQNINGLFIGMMHPDIRQKIESEHANLLTYSDKNGKQQRLSGQMVLNAAKDVLKEKGLTDRISGLPQPY